MLNKAQVMGYLGKDPEVRYMPNGNAVANFSVATSERWKDKETGDKMEKTEWHNVVAFGKTGEIAGEYLKKGHLVFVEGKLQTRKWDDKEGVTRYSTEIVVDQYGLKLMPQAGATEERGGAKTDRRPASAKAKPATKSRQPGGGDHAHEREHEVEGDGGEFDDDVPF